MGDEALGRSTIFLAPNDSVIRMGANRGTQFHEPCEIALTKMSCLTMDAGEQLSSSCAHHMPLLTRHAR